jgi:hypothetical protein
MSVSSGRNLFESLFTPLAVSAKINPKLFFFHPRINPVAPVINKNKNNQIPKIL